MSVQIIYRTATEYARPVEEFIHDFTQRTGKQIDVINPDTREGTNMCELYDIVEYPTILATNHDGQMRNMWQGLPLPTIDEVSYYVE